MGETLEPISFPELVIGIAGPIGVDMEAIAAGLESALKAMDYRSVPIRLTDEMRHIIHVDIAEPISGERDYYSLMLSKIRYANAVCEQLGDRAALARIAVRAIANRREELSGDRKTPNRKTAYIIRQLKRPAEIDTLQAVYGRQFILVSAYGSVEDRRQLIMDKIKRSASTLLADYEISSRVDELISKDFAEDDNDFGQQLRETFHRGDVFIDGIDKQKMRAKISRFIDALFGRNDIAPSKDEYGIYAAKSASLRSSDLSRQVGAAIIDDDGDIISESCNEVPRAFGGTYWDLEEPDHRDIRTGSDPNEISRTHMLRGLFERLKAHEFLSEKALAIGGPAEIVDALTRKPASNIIQPSSKPALEGAEIMDLTEYGRVVHAEMNAICSAARIGRSVRGATLYCTTFPCHNCTKHILACGIRRVVYIEPYPKSRAKDLHQHEISIEDERQDRVSFAPFLGISPYRYRDIFQKGRRKSSGGAAEEWYRGQKRPMINIVAATYIDIEAVAIAPLIAKTANNNVATPPVESSASQHA